MSAARQIIACGRLLGAARERVAGRSAVTAAQKLAHWLGTECGFQGCSKGYYRPENLFLDRNRCELGLFQDLDHPPASLQLGERCGVEL